MERRTFLRVGLAGTAALLGAGSGLALYSGQQIAAPRGPLFVLSPSSFQTLVAFARRVVTVRGADALSIAHGLDGLLRFAPPEVGADLDGALKLLESAAAGLLLDGRLVPFTRMGGPAQDAAILAWRDSNLGARRAGYQALRKLCFAVHYAEESSWAALGYAVPTGLNRAAYPDSKAGTKAWLAAQEAPAPTPPTEAGR